MRKKDKYNNMLKSNILFEERYNKKREITTEGLKGWMSTFLTLVSLGFISPAKAGNIDTEEKKNIVYNLSDKQKNIISNLSEKDIDTLAIVNSILYEGVEDFKEVNILFNKSKFNTSYEDYTLLNFVEDIQNQSKLVSAHMFLINIPIPTEDVMLVNVPLYGVKIKPNTKTEINLRSTLSKDFSIDADISDKLKVIFMVNPVFSSIGVNLKF